MTQHRMLRGGFLLVLLAVVVVAIQWYRNDTPPPPVVMTDPAPPETGAATSMAAAVAPAASSSAAAPAAEKSADTSSATTAPVMVHVVGAVRRPGVYRLPLKARLVDAVHAAGGAKAGADLEAVNLASLVRDGEQIRVPTLAERRALRMAAAPRPPAPRPLPKAPLPRPVRSTARYPLAAAAAATAATTHAASGAAALTAGGVVNINTATAEELDTLPGVGPSTAAAILAFRKDHGPFQRVEDLLDVRGIGEKKLAAMRDRVTVR
jgi:competence protein ComEA